MSAMINKTLSMVDAGGKLIPAWLIALLARWSIAYTFWMSGRSKVSGFLDISQSTFFLFEHEYALPLVPHQIAAYLATYAEHFFPILIILGLFTRFAALSLLIMTAAIQIFVYPDAWDVHMWWAVAMLYLVRYGAGALSLDNLLRSGIHAPSR